MKDIKIEHAFMAGAVLLLGVGLMNGGTASIREDMATRSELKERRRQATVEQVRSNVKAEELERRAEVARQRLENGAVPVFHLDQPQYYGNLKEGTIIYDRASCSVECSTLPAGVVVFNGYGTTAVIDVQGRASDIATVTDTALIQVAYDKWINDRAGSGAGTYEGV